MKAKSLVLVAMFAALTAIGAFIKVPIPVVPFTLQIVVVFLAASLLGSKRALYSQLVYIAVGLAGVPVFNEGGGLAYIFKPSFGYLIGFALAAYVMGAFLERKASPTRKDFITANLVGLVCIYGVALPYLYYALNFWLGMDTSWIGILAIGFSGGALIDVGLAIITGLFAMRLHQAFKAAGVLPTMADKHLA